MTDTTDEDATHGTQLRRVVKLVLAAGAVATALGAIIALGQALWPDSSQPAPQMRATISDLQVDPEVPLAEYLETTSSAGGGSRQTARVPGPVFASASVAEPATPTNSSSPQPAPEPPPPPPPPSTVPEPPSNTTTAPEPPTPTTPQPPADPGGEEPGGTVPRDPRVPGLLAEVQRRPIEDVVELSTGSSDPAAVRTTEFLRIIVDDADAAPEEVRQVLASSRLRVSDAAGAEPKLSPLGVVVNFSAQIDGYRGKQSVVRWSLFYARKRTRMPQPWLRNRDALTLVPEAGSDRGSPSVWVPLPQERGPYFVRLELFDDRGTRLEREDTKRFDR